jgi:hypothetical protein
MPRIRPFSPVLVAVAAAALSACGGGGDGGEPDAEPLVTIPTDTRAVAASAGSDLTADTLSDQGNWLARAVLSTARDGIFDITAEREQPTMVRAASVRAAAGLTPWSLARAVLRVAAPRYALREQLQATSSQVLDCTNAGGTFTITIDDQDGDQQVSSGDGIGIVAANCALEAGIAPASGSMQMTVNAVELDPQSEPKAIDATIVLGNLTISSYGTYNGQLRLWAKPDAAGERARVSYRQTAVTLGGTQVVFDFDVTSLTVGAQTQFDLNGGLGLGGHTYSVVAGATMTAAAPDAPSDGWVRLRDAAGDETRLTARSVTTFDLDFFPAGAAAATAQLPARLWADALPPQP